MDLMKEKVKHRTLGVGEVIELDGQCVTIQFPARTTKFTYPSAFEDFLTLEDADKHNAVLAELSCAKQAAEEKKRVEREAREKAEEARKAAIAVKAPSAGRQRAKNLDEMFSEDYHVAYLARQPILTYQQVEEKFGIKVSGFGRGINPTATTVVLISSIGKAGGNFVEVR